jgi:hypothetical protein
MIGQFVSVTLNGFIEALEYNGAPVGASQRVERGRSSRLVTFENTSYRDTVSCLNGGTVTRDLRITGVTQGDDWVAAHLNINGTVTYSNCQVYASSTEAVIVDGTFTVQKNTGRTPTGQQVLRKNGEIAWRKLPQGTSGTCRADWNVNFYNLRDPRARADGTFCDVAVNVDVPTVVPFPKGTPTTPPVAGPTPAPGPGPTPTPRPGPTPTPQPGPTPTPRPGPTPTPAPGPGLSNAAGRWAGSIATDAVRSGAGFVICPEGAASWQATVTVNGSAVTLAWTDSYHGNTTPFTVTGTVGSDRRLTITVGSGDDRITLVGTLSTDYRSIDGTRRNNTGSVDGPLCTQATGRIPGDWNGTRQ